MGSPHNHGQGAGLGGGATTSRHVEGRGDEPTQAWTEGQRGDKGQSNMQRGPRGGRGQQGQSHNEDAISTGWQSETGQKGAAGALAVSRVGHEAAATEETNAFQVAKG